MSRCFDGCASNLIFSPNPVVFTMWFCAAWWRLEKPIPRRGWEGKCLRRVVSYFRCSWAHRTAGLCLPAGLHVLLFWEYRPRNQPFLSVFWGWEGWTDKAEDVCGHLGHWRQRVWLRAYLWLNLFHTRVLLPTAGLDSVSDATLPALWLLLSAWAFQLPPFSSEIFVNHFTSTGLSFFLFWFGGCIADTIAVDV